MAEEEESNRLTSKLILGQGKDTVDKDDTDPRPFNITGVCICVCVYVCVRMCMC